MNSRTSQGFWSISWPKQVKFQYDLLRNYRQSKKMIAPFVCLGLVPRDSLYNMLRELLWLWIFIHWKSMGLGDSKGSSTSLTPDASSSELVVPWCVEGQRDDDFSVLAIPRLIEGCWLNNKPSKFSSGEGLGVSSSLPSRYCLLLVRRPLSFLLLLKLLSPLAACSKLCQAPPPHCPECTSTVFADKRTKLKIMRGRWQFCPSQISKFADSEWKMTVSIHFPSQPSHGRRICSLSKYFAQQMMRLNFEFFPWMFKVNLQSRYLN